MTDDPLATSPEIAAMKRLAKQSEADRERERSRQAKQGRRTRRE